MNKWKRILAACMAAACLLAETPQMAYAAEANPVQEGLLVNETADAVGVGGESAEPGTDASEMDVSETGTELETGASDLGSPAAGTKTDPVAEETETEFETETGTEPETDVPGGTGTAAGEGESAETVPTENAFAGVSEADVPDSAAQAASTETEEPETEESETEESETEGIAAISEEAEIHTTVYDGVDYALVYDYDYYVSRYSDANAYGNDDVAVLKHFVTVGMSEGRQAIAGFDVYSYAYQYSDLRRVFGNTLKSYYLHYIEYGYKENRKAVGVTSIQNAWTVYDGVDYSRVYDYTYYISAYSDLRSVYGPLNDWGALQHFVAMGMSEGRRAISGFDVYSYAYQYSDLRKAFGNTLKSYYLHYIEYGYKEGRKTTGVTSMQNVWTVYDGVDYAPVYDYAYYMSAYSDVRSAYGSLNDWGALVHFATTGIAESRQACEAFNVKYYAYTYTDLRRAFGTDARSYYLHYISYGIKEGRSGNGTITYASTAVYDGIDYSRVYNYEYYITRYSDLWYTYGNDAYAALEHFVLCGINEGRQGISTFDVYSYAYQYSDLRKAFGNTLRSYYLHYIETGYQEGRKAVGVTSMQDVWTVYNGVDYSLVYDFTYYTSKYPDIKAAFGSLNDWGALQHFVTAGMSARRQAKASFVVEYYYSNYPDLRNAFGTNYAAYYLHYIGDGYREGRVADQLLTSSVYVFTNTAQTAMVSKAQIYSSSTGYLILVNTSTHKVGVFTGSAGNWSLLKYWDCGDGKASTPTVKGVFTVGIKGYYFDSGNSRCYYYTQFYGNYLFHSILYNKYTGAISDASLGVGVSHGCVRLALANAKYIYDTIPSRTTVVVY